MNEKYVLVLLAVMVLGLAIIRPDAGFRLRAFMQGAPDFACGAGAELTALKTELARQSIFARESVRTESTGILAEVYSQYPFGSKSELLVNRGKEDGVQVGQPALFRKMFVGRVTKAFPRAALITTLFDARAKYSVRIGKEGTDALFVGGNEPRITLIANAAVLENGAAIYTATPLLPYGLAVGIMSGIHASREGLFQEAGVSFPYDIAQIRMLNIITSFTPPL